MYNHEQEIYGTKTRITKINHTRVGYTNGITLHRVPKCDVTSIWIFEIMGFIKIIGKSMMTKLTPTCPKLES